jgi:hypothetical protein
MMIMYSISGIALAMVGPMAFALIGKYVPLNKRANATGYLIARAGNKRENKYRINYD